MGIEQAKVPLHWNYFLYLEDDIANLSRWIEFTKNNFDCYSIELARLLMAACSETDVVAKRLCSIIDKDSRASSIHKYREVITNSCKRITSVQVEMPRYGLTFTPWSSWNEEKVSPLWWNANNKVKHQRSDHFDKANLKNTLNAAAGLLILLVLYYSKNNHRLSPATKLFSVNNFAIVRDDFIMFHGC